MLVLELGDQIEQCLHLPVDGPFGGQCRCRPSLSASSITGAPGSNRYALIESGLAVSLIAETFPTGSEIVHRARPAADKKRQPDDVCLVIRDRKLGRRARQSWTS